MKALSAHAALACESASTERCRCRCQGALHGAARGDLDALAALPRSDPHHVRQGPPRRPLVGVQTTIPDSLVPEQQLWGRRRYA